MKRFTKCGICGKVECACTVIQNQKFRFLNNGTGNCQSLTLTAGKISTILFQLEIKLTIFSLNNFTCLGSGQCIPDFFIGCIFASPFHIITNRPFKKCCTLRYNTDFFTEIMLAVGSDILPIHQNRSLCDIVKTCDQVDESGFATAGTADDSDSLAFLYRKADIRKTWCACACIGKGNILKFYGIFSGCGSRSGVIRIIHGSFYFKDVGNTVCTCGRFVQSNDQRCKFDELNDHLCHVIVKRNNFTLLHVT